MSILVAIGILLVVLWILGLLFFKIVGFAIHLLLIVGIILLIVGLMRRGANAIRRRV